jgi:hypothetical protein
LKAVQAAGEKIILPILPQLIPSGNPHLAAQLPPKFRSLHLH